MHAANGVLTARNALVLVALGLAGAPGVPIAAEAESDHIPAPAPTLNLPKQLGDLIPKGMRDLIPTAPTRPAPTATALAITPAEQRFGEDSTRFRSVVFGGMLSGLATGGAVGGIDCVLRNKDDRKRKDCMRNVAVAATIAGASQGYVVAKREQAGRNELRATQAATADIQADNARLQAMVDSSEAMVRESRDRLMKLREDIAAKRVAADEAIAARRREEANLQRLNDALADARGTRDEYAKASKQFKGPPAARRDLDAEIATMSKRVDTLEQSVKQLSAALEVSRV